MFTMADGIASFLMSLLGGFIIKERPGDVDLNEDDLLQVKRVRAVWVVSLMFISSSIAFILSWIIKEDLKRLNYQKHDDKTDAEA